MEKEHPSVTMVIQKLGKSSSLVHLCITSFFHLINNPVHINSPLTDLGFL